jgi:hypothetical protein
VAREKEEEAAAAEKTQEESAVEIESELLFKSISK